MSSSRRSFLRGTAGAILALPFLEALPGSRARAADLPKRFVTFHRAWGTVPSHWTPDGVGADFTLREIMRPLQGLKDRGKLSVVTGVSMESAQAQYEGSGSHPCGENHALTARFQRDETYRCVKWVDGRDAEVPIGHYRECLDGNLDIFGGPGGASIDSVIAEHTWPGTRLKHLVVGRGGGLTSTYDAVNDRVERVPAIRDAVALFDALFADATTDTAAFEATRRRRASILDHARGEMDALRSRVSSRDREQLESHYTAIREIELGLEASRRACTVPERPFGELTFDGPQWIETMHLAHRLIAMALACDITRNVSIFWHTDGVPLDTLRSLDARIHADPHGEGSHAFPGDTARIDNAVALHQVFMGLFAHLADELDSADRLEAGGSTVLDNAVLLHTSDMTTGLHTFKAGSGPWTIREGGQYARGMPYLYAGSAGGALRTNQHFVLDDDAYVGRHSHGELFLTLARAMGVTEEQLPTFGEPDYGRRTIGDLLL
ncbi:MAG: DUF1552 domain-containing protein [Deltaproteobacteria bacterium]|nr:DUF1552 domain-containing protein [Deltaproteobacteria bacterium]